MKIVFQKQRNFGEIINAAFAFVNQEFKIFVKSLFFFSGPFILIGTFLAGVNQFSVLKNMTNNSVTPFLDRFSFVYIFGYFFLFLALVIIMDTVFSYIKLYIDDDGFPITVERVGKEVLKNFWKILVTNLILSVIYVLVGVISILFLLIPFFYIVVSTLLIYPVQFFENKDFSTSFSRSFQLIKQRWWFTFGLTFVTALVINIMSGFVSLPLTAIAGAISYGLGFDDSSKIIVLATLTYYAFAIIAYYILSSVIFIIISFQYFNLVEEKEHPALFQRIKEINAEKNIV